VARITDSLQDRHRTVKSARPRAGIRELCPNDIVKDGSALLQQGPDSAVDEVRVLGGVTTVKVSFKLSQD